MFQKEISPRQLSMLEVGRLISLGAWAKLPKDTFTREVGARCPTAQTKSSIFLLTKYDFVTDTVVPQEYPLIGWPASKQL